MKRSLTARKALGTILRMARRMPSPVFEIAAHGPEHRMRRVMARDRAQSLDADAASAHDPKRLALSLARNLNPNRR